MHIFLLLGLLLSCAGPSLCAGADPSHDFSASLEFSKGEGEGCMQGVRLFPPGSEFHLPSFHSCLRFACLGSGLRLLPDKSGCSSGSQCIGHGEPRVKNCVRSLCNVTYDVMGQKLSVRTQLITMETGCQIPTGCLPLKRHFLEKGTCTKYTCTRKRGQLTLVPSYDMCVDNYDCREPGFTRAVTRAACLEEKCVLVGDIARFQAFYKGCPSGERCLAFGSVTASRRGNQCFKVNCTQTDIGLYRLEETPECLFEGLCYQEGETVRDTQLCSVIQCALTDSQLGWRVYEKECAVDRHTCLPVGSTMALARMKGCTSLTCVHGGAGQVTLQETITGCQMEDGSCLAVGEVQETEDCQRQECVTSGTVLAYIRTTRSGCRMPSGRCLKLQESYVEEVTCLEYACAREISFFQMTFPGLKVTKLCRDNQGRCYKKEDTFRNGVETCVCMQQGPHLVPSCFVVNQ